MAKKPSKKSIKPVTLNLPHRGASQLTLAKALELVRGMQQSGHLQQALQALAQLAQQAPTVDEVWLSWFDVFHQLSDFPALEKITNDCLQHKPRFVPALISKGVALRMASVHYALARACEFTGDRDKQFQHIEAGAAHKKQASDYQHADEMQEMQAIAECFTPELLRSNRDETGNTKTQTDENSATPIFICGLPRSGTTLVEQILSSHAQVTAGDELTALPLVTGKRLQQLGITKPFPHWAQDLSEQDWQRIGDDYLKHTQSLQSQAFFTDKNLQNYKAVGLIHRALPQAKIIYCRRNPMDNLWGCYRQLFGNGLLFTYDQQELAETWQAAEKLLDYWQQQLAKRIFVVDYEALIEDQQAVTQQLLEFVGLEWSDDCLRFYENERAVSTVSSLQVRQPLSSERVGQWRHYEQYLQPMLAALENSAAEHS